MPYKAIQKTPYTQRPPDEEEEYYSNSKTTPVQNYWERPTLVQEQGYTLTPDYIKHKPYEDKLAILVCQIKIWKAESPNWFPAPPAENCLTLRECESIEITDSVNDLVGKAVIRFPRGTVIHKRNEPEKTVVPGDKESGTDKKTEHKEAGKDGEFLSTQIATYEDGTSTTSTAIDYDDMGLLQLNQSKDEPALLSPHDVAIGNRIEIRLGYAYSDMEEKEMLKTDNHKNLDVCFTGFITSVSVGTPLELECSNMAHVFTTVSSQNVVAKGTIELKNFLDSGSKYDMLKNTGITLADCSQGLEIEVNGEDITDNLTASDVIAAWSKSGVRCVMDLQKDGTVKFRAGLSFFTGLNGNKPMNDDKNYITYNGGNNSVMMIQSDWDVANDKLSFKQINRKYLAVEAQGRLKTGEFFKFTLREHPEKPGTFQIVNRRTIKQRKKMKFIHGVLSNLKVSGIDSPAKDLKRYHIAPYVSPKIGITEKQLEEEAKQYWAKYDLTGISGSLELFGDVPVKISSTIGFIDVRNPEKNGYYYVEEVSTTFGVNGFRRELKIPFKIASFSKPIKVIQ